MDIFETEYQGLIAEGMSPDEALNVARLRCTRNTGPAIKRYLEEVEAAYQAKRRELAPLATAGQAVAPPAATTN